MDSIISDSNSIFKFLKQLDLDLFLSKPQFNHLNQFLNVMIQENYQGKISAVKHCHRTTFGRFLNDSPWDDGRFLIKFKPIFSLAFTIVHIKQENLFTY